MQWNLAGCPFIKENKIFKNLDNNVKLKHDQMHEAMMLYASQ